MTHFIISEQSNFNKWMYQNEAEYTGDFYEGCLLDNFIVSTKRGYCFIYEKYASVWTSVWNCYFVPYKDERDIAIMFARFYEAEEASRREAEEDEEFFKQRFGEEVTTA